MATRTCWKCCGCTIVEDYFTTSELGGAWDEVDGDWSNFLSDYLTIDGAGLIATTLGHSPPQHVETTYYSETAGATFRLIADYVDDDNYHCLEVVVSDSFTAGDVPATMQLIKRSGGSDTALSDAVDTMVVGGAITPAHLCVREGVVSGWFGYKTNSDPGEYWLHAATTLHDGQFAGLATITSGDHYFDYFHLQRSSDDCSGCPTCQHCSGVMPSRLQIELPALAEGAVSGPCCSDIAGTYITEQTDDGQGIDEYPCAWYALVDYGCADPLRIVVTLQDGLLGISIADDVHGAIASWSVDLEADQPDCAAWDDLALALGSVGPFNCDDPGGDTTAYITALP